MSDAAGNASQPIIPHVSQSSLPTNSCSDEPDCYRLFSSPENSCHDVDLPMKNDHNKSNHYSPLLTDLGKQNVIRIPCRSVGGRPLPSAVSEEAEANNKSPSQVPSVGKIPHSGAITSNALHAAVSSSTSSCGELRATLLAVGPSAAADLDANGRLPLHVLSMNKLLIGLHINQARFHESGNISLFDPISDYWANRDFKMPPNTDLDKFVMELTRANPMAVITKDFDGRVPFTYALYDWVENSVRGGVRELRHTCSPTSTTDNTPLKRVGRSTDTFLLDQNQLEKLRLADNPYTNDDEMSTNRSILTTTTNLTLPTVFRSAYTTSSEPGHPATHYTYRTTTRAEEEGAFEVYHVPAKGRVSDKAGAKNSPIVRCTNIVNTFKDPDVDKTFPLNVSVPLITEWSLRMLSAMLDTLDDMDMTNDLVSREAWSGTFGTGIERPQTVSSMIDSIRTSLTMAVASVPSLMKTLLLVNDNDAAKNRLFGLSIVKLIISSQYSIDNWLVNMIEADNKSVAKQGVLFLEMISDIPEEELPPQKRADLYNKVAQLDRLIPATLALKQVENIHRTASTRVLRHIIDSELKLKRTTMAVFFDIAYLLLLLLSFQMCTNHVLSFGVHDARYWTIYSTALICILFGFVRRLSLMALTLKLCWSTFAANCTFVNVIDVMALGFALVSAIWMEIEARNRSNMVSGALRTFLAITTFMLWVRVLSWLYVINWGAAKFFQAIKQILFDLRWLLMVLVITVLSFAQIFFIVLSSSGSCDNEGGFCDPKDVYIQVYALMMGQFDTTEFYTATSVVIFVVFTFLVFVVLFQTTTALSIDSYSKTMARQADNCAYGHTPRLVYVANLQRFGRFMQGGWSVLQCCANSFLLVCIAGVLMVAAAKIYDSFVEYRDAVVINVAISVLVGFILLSIASFLMYLTCCDSAEKAKEGSSCSNFLAKSKPIKVLAMPLRVALLSVSGVYNNIQHALSTSHMKPKRKWLGTVSNVHRDMVELVSLAETRTNATMRKEVEALESRMNKLLDRSRLDVLHRIQSSSIRLESMIGEIQAILLAQNQTNRSHERSVPGDYSGTKADSASRDGNQLKSEI